MTGKPSHGLHRGSHKSTPARGLLAYEATELQLGSALAEGSHRDVFPLTTIRDSLTGEARQGSALMRPRVPDSGATRSSIHCRANHARGPQRRNLNEKCC